MTANTENIASSWVFNKTDTHLDLTGHHTVYTQVQENGPVNLHKFPFSETDISCRPSANYLT